MNPKYQPLNIHNHNIYAAFNNHKVYLKNNKVLDELIKNETLICRDIAQTLKNAYSEFMKKELKITTDSMALEILGNVYPNKVSPVIYNILPALSSVPDFSLDKTDIIDIGESGYDSSRLIWDKLEPLYLAITCRLH
ncbi:MAG: hypothetical protein GX308_04200 [Epulopiscium sp.]|nr:hypothetical protein [Candidatus Epulonipiscium sp.]